MVFIGLSAEETTERHFPALRAMFGKSYLTTGTLSDGKKHLIRFDIQAFKIKPEDFNMKFKCAAQSETLTVYSIDCIYKGLFAMNVFIIKHYCKLNPRPILVIHKNTIFTTAWV